MRDGLLYALLGLEASVGDLDWFNFFDADHALQHFILVLVSLLFCALEVLVARTGSDKHFIVVH